MMSFLKLFVNDKGLNKYVNSIEIHRTILPEVIGKLLEVWLDLERGGQSKPASCIVHVCLQATSSMTKLF